MGVTGTSAGDPPSQTMAPTLVTGNAGKIREFERLWPGLHVVKLDLPELQGDSEEVAVAKMRSAMVAMPGVDLVVEDSSLCYDALGGLPGVYVKWFLAAVGLRGLYDMLAAYEDKTAYGQCVVVTCVDGVVATHVGRTRGRIVAPRGDGGFGWDAVFQPDGHDLTYAEMTPEVKDSVSDRGRAVARVKT